MKISAENVLEVFLNMDTPKTSKDFLEKTILRYDFYELKEIDLSELDAGYTDPDRLEKYTQLTTEPPPILLDHRKVIYDGFHRVKSQKAMGKKTIMAYVPLGDPYY